MKINGLKESGSLNLIISHIYGMSNRWAQEQGINPYKLKPLYALYLDPSMTQKQISDCCSIPKQTVSNAVRELKTNGYIILEAAGEDKREKHIMITESGKKYLAETIAPVVELEERVIARMGKWAYEILLDGLKKYAEAMETEVGK